VGSSEEVSAVSLPLVSDDVGDVGVEAGEITSLGLESGSDLRLPSFSAVFPLLGFTGLDLFLMSRL